MADHSASHPSPHLSKFSATGSFSRSGVPSYHHDLIIAYKFGYLTSFCTDRQLRQDMTGPLELI